MWIDYMAKSVLKRVTIDVPESFNINVAIPAIEVRRIVERNFNQEGDYGWASFNKITAIKEVRDSHLGIPYLSIGLREAKEMVEAIYQEGVSAGNYHQYPPVNSPSTDDTLPF
tara:strand:+ start:1092 stop:1430 length:339 start_codon:yes stop_codon:yes gene_type:complete